MDRMINKTIERYTELQNDRRIERQRKKKLITKEKDLYLFFVHKRLKMMNAACKNLAPCVSSYKPTQNVLPQQKKKKSCANRGRADIWGHFL